MKFRNLVGSVAIVTSLTCTALAQTLTFVGDINLGRRGAGDWAALFMPVQSALQGDLVIGNLESPLTDKPHQGHGFNLRALPQTVAALHPFTHLSVENNHALDSGEVGQRQNRALLLENHLQPVTTQPIFVKWAGRTLALLSYLDGPQGAPIQAVQDARKKADEVIVMPHWGAEYDGITSRQREQARKLATTGATLIVGSGPHVLQGTERIGDTLVIYSLGNFLFDQPYPATWLGGALHVTRSSEQWTVCFQPTFSRGGQVRLATQQEALKAAEKTGLSLCR